MVRSTSSVPVIDILAGLWLGLWLLATPVQAQEFRSFVSVVGAPAPYRFLSQVVERFGEQTIFKYPLIEATGTDAGVAMFCLGIGIGTPDMLMLDRRLSLEEYARCSRNGVGDIVELSIGHEALVIVTANETQPLDLSLVELFLALAETVPDPSNPETMVANPHQRWRDLGQRLPDTPIRVVGPAPWHALGRLLVERGLQEGCRQRESVMVLAETNPEQYRQICSTLRADDRHYLMAEAEADALLAQIQAEPGQLALVIYDFYDRHREALRHVLVDSVPPAVGPIKEQRYALSRPIHVYLKRGHLELVPGLREFAEELVDEYTLGPRGYLRELGLVSPAPPDRKSLVETVELMRAMEAPTAEPDPAAAPGSPEEEAPPQDPLLVLEMAVWEQVADSEDPALVALYLEKFPEGQFSELARQQLEQLQAAAEVEAKVEAEVEALQDAEAGEATTD